MKIYLEYEELKSNVLKMSEIIQKEYNPDYIVSIVRGGLTISHIMAKYMRLEVLPVHPEYVNEIDFGNKKILFVDDLIAKGRTLNVIKSNTSLNPEKHRIYTYLIDSQYCDTYPEYYSMISSDWIVFPWEEYDKTIEGDHGLFRERSDVYGK